MLLAAFDLNPCPLTVTPPAEPQPGLKIRDSEPRVVGENTLGIALPPASFPVFDLPSLSRTCAELL